MQIKQLSVFVENKPGRMAEIAGVLGNSNVDIRAISVADTSDFGILRVIVDKPDIAVKALKENGMTVSLTDVLAVGIDDKPGSFARSLEVLAKEDIGIEYMYAFISRESGRAYIIIRADDGEKASKALEKSGAHILTSEEIYNM